ncbi:7893_t:CDS:2 [Diversispora eburnea]|uniref:7893_t:CDS:1 n=1 Tax=Diversispora eburnea TaxID=1213867 RepID=A0A9N9BH32_9GLOM|nr:7893_t:CDS:2 [Diversispora eburnea]
MEEEFEFFEPINTSITAPGRIKKHDNTSNVSSSLEEPTNTSKFNDFDHSFELIDSPTTSSNILHDLANVPKSKSVSIKEPPQENDDIEDLSNDKSLVFPTLSLIQNEGRGGSESDSDLSSDGSENSQAFGNEYENNPPSQRLSKLRDFKRHQFNFPVTVRIMYIGQNVPEQCKRRTFAKICESLSQIFWEEADGLIPPNDVGPEKRSIIGPVSKIPDDGKPHLEYYSDSGVALCEVDLTNGPCSRVFDYFQNQFSKTDSDTNFDINLVDLCIAFIPPDANNILPELLSTMKKLHDKVTLFPIIALQGKELYAQDEREEKRLKILKYFEDNGIEIFIWKADEMIEDVRDRWVETVYTKKILTVEDFVAFEAEYIYEDLQLLRTRAIEFKKERLRNERAKRRQQLCDKVASILKDIVIVGAILYIVYFSISSVWQYAEWSILPSDLAKSFQAVSRASLKTQDQNGPKTIHLDFGETEPLINVNQESSSRFVFDILNKDQLGNFRKENFDVVVTHNPPQVLGRSLVEDLGNGRYFFDIDTTGAQGEVKVEIKKNGQVVKEVPWSPMTKEGDKLDTSIITKTGDGWIYDTFNTFNEAATDINIKINSLYETVKNALYESAVYIGTEMLAISTYVGNQVTESAKNFWGIVKLWFPYALEKIKEFTNYTEVKFYYFVKRMRKGANRMGRIVMTQFGN